MKGNKNILNLIYSYILIKNKNNYLYRSHLSDKTDFNSEAVTRDQEGHCIMIKGSIYQEDITILNIYIYIQYQTTQI